ncbi:hypothetical protein GBA52_024274 [Prunus armeniaca]|nr:hypothetical protein GBA52_024274 [Prunus armeniaca]
MTGLRQGRDDCHVAMAASREGDCRKWHCVGSGGGERNGGEGGGEIGDVVVVVMKVEVEVVVMALTWVYLRSGVGLKGQPWPILKIE